MTPARALSLDGEALRSEVDAVRARSTGAVTNWFLSPLRASAVKAWATEASLAFVDAEHDLHRVYFVTTDAVDLRRALGAIDAAPLVLDHFTRGPIEPGIAAAAEAAGFRRAARYLRIKKSLGDGARGKPPERARADEVDRLAAGLERDFDVRLDYVPTRDDLADLVARGQVLVKRSGPEILGYLVYRVEGFAVKWEYLGTRPDAPPTTASALISEFEGDLADRNLKLVTGWVDERKRALLAAYDGLGYREDGLARTTFVKGDGWQPGDRAAVTYAIAAPGDLAGESDVRRLVLAALGAVNDAVPAEMQVALEDDAPLSPLDSLALMNLLVGVEQAIAEGLEVEIRVTDAATFDDGAPLARVGSLIAFAAGRVTEARGR